MCDAYAAAPDGMASAGTLVVDWAAAMPVDLWKERVAKGDFWQAVAVMAGGPGLLPKLLFFSPMVMRSRWRLKLACYGM